MQAAAVLYVANLEIMRAFYSECFALGAVDADEDFSALASDAWLVTLVRGPNPPTVTVPAVRRSHTPIKLAFTVPGIDALREVVERLGGAVEPAESSWRFRGALHCDCLDPEGNVVQLIEAAD